MGDEANRVLLRRVGCFFAWLILSIGTVGLVPRVASAATGVDAPLSVAAELTEVLDVLNQPEAVRFRGLVAAIREHALSIMRTDAVLSRDTDREAYGLVSESSSRLLELHIQGDDTGLTAWLEAVPDQPAPWVEIGLKESRGQHSLVDLWLSPYDRPPGDCVFRPDPALRFYAEHDGAGDGKRWTTRQVGGREQPHGRVLLLPGHLRDIHVKSAPSSQMLLRITRAALDSLRRPL